jgi:hypothetical protein
MVDTNDAIGRYHRHVPSSLTMVSAAMGRYRRAGQRCHQMESSQRFTDAEKHFASRHQPGHGSTTSSCRPRMSSKKQKKITDARKPTTSPLAGDAVPANDVIVN